jgi:hypothetical protein
VAADTPADAPALPENLVTLVDAMERASEAFAVEDLEYERGETTYEAFQHAVAAQESARAALDAHLRALVADGERWRTLMASERIRVLGSAALGNPHAQLIGVEFYTRYSPRAMSETRTINANHESLLCECGHEARMHNASAGECYAGGDEATCGCYEFRPVPPEAAPPRATTVDVEFCHGFADAAERYVCRFRKGHAGPCHPHINRESSVHRATTPEQCYGCRFGYPLDARGWHVDDARATFGGPCPNHPIVPPPETARERQTPDAVARTALCRHGYAAHRCADARELTALAARLANPPEPEELPTARETRCPNPNCNDGKVGNLGCAICSSAPTPDDVADEPIGKHGPYGSHTNTDGSLVPTPAASREEGSGDAALSEKAWKVVMEMCRGGRWRMSIPLHPDDSDEILATLVRRFNEILAEQATLTARLARAEGAYETIVAEYSEKLTTQACDFLASNDRDVVQWSRLRDAVNEYHDLRRDCPDEATRDEAWLTVMECMGYDRASLSPAPTRTGE